MFGGFAGAFFATRQGFISPESFTFIESATILAIVVLGGLGSQLGVALASIALIGGFEALRHTQGLKVIFGPDFDPALYRMLLFGLAMVVIMLWRPRGIVSSRTPSILLEPQARRRSEPRSAAHERVAEGPGPQGRTPDHALWRPYGGRRRLLRGGTPRHHRADRPERRGQDHRVQLHHRLLQADRRDDHAHPSRWIELLSRAPRRSRHQLAAPGSPAPSRTSGCSRA